MTAEPFIKISARLAYSEVGIISEVNIYNKMGGTVAIITIYK
jgi:hypothetical protein